MISHTSSIFSTESIISCCLVLSLLLLSFIVTKECVDFLLSSFRAALGEIRLEASDL